MENKNLPAATINHSQKALEMVQKHVSDHDLVFVAEEDLRTQTMFLPEVVIIRSTPDDFHNISGKFMPKGYQTDRIGEASGIVFLENCGTRVEEVDGDTAYVGFAQGKKRMPDGTWRPSSVCEYEFNPVKRAEEDFLKDTQGNYKTENQKKIHLLGLQKFGRQRANTGARLRVIRELTGMPISFKADQLQRAMVFSRVAVNTDLFLSDPEMREAAIKVALGAGKEIYGPSPERKALSDGYTVENGNEDTEQPAEGFQAPEWGAPAKEETDDERILREMVEDLQIRRKKHDGKLPDNGKAEIDQALAEEHPDPKVLSGLIDRLDAWEESLKAQEAAR